MSDRNSAAGQLIFLHIPKTAGTAVEEYVASSPNYADFAAYIHSGDGSGIGIQQFYKDNMDKPFIFGHFPYCDLPVTRPESIYFTFLRDPIERCISQYHSWQRAGEQSDAHLENASSELLETLEFTKHSDAEDWFLSERKDIVDVLSDVQTNFLGNRASDMEARLASAKSNLLSLDFFGLREAFSESVSKLRSLVPGLPRYGVPWVKENRTPTSTRISRQELSSITIERLNELNRHDLSLYRFALEHFYE
ncbi:sulfotransferase family protein [Luminiphilus sp.]|nr:sulfotransferase family protein [Luminiphilus sp.]